MIIQTGTTYALQGIHALRFFNAAPGCCRDYNEERIAPVVSHEKSLRLA